MKIDRLYTLSQFVELIDESDCIDYPKREEYNVEKMRFIHYCLISAYNKFLKQPLRKEMFVNEIQEPYKLTPLALLNKDAYDEHYKTWQESEKKVIFETTKIYEDNELNIHSLHIEIDKVKIEFLDSDMITTYMDNSDEYLVNKLEDLAYYTQGQLKLKNVTI